MSDRRLLVAAFTLPVLLAIPAFAQQALPEVPPLGSPAATVTIPGEQLPPPPQKFGGKIERAATKSTPYWPARIVPPKSAPGTPVDENDDSTPLVFSGKLNKITLNIDRPKLSPEDIKRLEARTAGDGPSADADKTSAAAAAPALSSDIELALKQKVELRLDKREGAAVGRPKRKASA